MCWSEKCCFCLKLNHGCLLTGFLTSVLSLAMAVSSIYLLAAEADHNSLQHHHTMHRLLGFFHLEVNHESKEVIFGIALLVSALWFLASVMLILGVKRNRSDLILVYFGYAIFIAFFALLSSLLLLLQGVWMVSFALAVVSLIYIHCLVAVHTFYELQVQGKVFVNRQSDDEEALVMT